MLQHFATFFVIFLDIGRSISYHSSTGILQHWNTSMAEQTLTDAELVVLSLICEQPQHGYQLENHITQRNMRAWTDLSTSSIYYLLGKLEEKGFMRKV